MLVLIRMEPNEALEAGVPVEILIAEGIIPSVSLEAIRLRERITRNTVREGQELVEKYSQPCCDVQNLTSKPDEF